MSTCLFGFPDWTQATPLVTPAVTGSSGWLSDLPKGNTIDRRLHRIARSVDTNPSNSQLVIDLGAARAVGLCAILIPNLTKSTTPTVQWVAASDAGFSTVVYSSGALQPWPTGVTAEDVIGPDGADMNVWHVHVLPSTQTARYWATIITDTGNADGYIDVARVIIAGAFRPSVHMVAGASSGLNDDTVVTKTDGGARLFQAKRTERTDAFTLANVPTSESLTSIRRMQRRLGKSGQVFFVWDDADTYGYERNYLATMEELGPLQYPVTPNAQTVAFKMVEVL